MTTLSELAEKQAELDSLRKSHGKLAVINELAAFFSKYPEMSIGWTQYSPHFNDGEPCTFSVYDLYIWKGQLGEEDSMFDQKCVSSLSYYATRGDPADREEWMKQPMVDDAIALDKLLRENEGTLEVAFGDGVQVVASKDGVVVEDCDHD